MEKPTKKEGTMAKKPKIPPLSNLERDKRMELANTNLPLFLETRSSIKKHVIIAVILAVIAVVLLIAAYVIYNQYYDAAYETWYDVILLIAGVIIGICAIFTVPKARKKRRALRSDLAKIDARFGNRDEAFKQIQEQFVNEEYPVYFVENKQYITKGWVVDLSKKNPRLIPVADIAGLTSITTNDEGHIFTNTHATLSDASQFIFDAMTPEPDDDESASVGSILKDIAVSIVSNKKEISEQIALCEQLYEILTEENPHIVLPHHEVILKNGKPAAASKAFDKKQYRSIVNAFDENRKTG